MEKCFFPNTAPFISPQLLGRPSPRPWPWALCCARRRRSVAPSSWCSGGWGSLGCVQVELCGCWARAPGRGLCVSVLFHTSRCLSGWSRCKGWSPWPGTVPSWSSSSCQCALGAAARWPRLLRVCSVDVSQERQAALCAVDIVSLWEPGSPGEADCHLLWSPCPDVAP